jgi:hypothetical protein
LSQLAIGNIRQDAGTVSDVRAVLAELQAAFSVAALPPANAAISALEGATRA